MPTAETRLATDRASRYLVQLCRHLRRMPRMSHRPPGGHGEGGARPEVRHVELTDTHGTVRFADGLWTLDATADALTLRVDADDEEALRRLQEAIAARIEKIGRRDALQVTWQRAVPDTPSQAECDEHRDTDGRGVGRSRRAITLGALGLVAGGAVVVAAHLGIGGAVLADAKWTGWAAGAVLALVLVKLLLLGGHLLLGRTALRRGIAFRHLGKRYERTGADVTG
ncbi:DUF2218 domain-containing protein [Streptomyces sp. NPDC059378]|uniref:DUF2218 domain-containing protein n=1 Tax=Streptomyces sp. NPDC059378 TaxID=3346815 RepID=UPI0036D1AC7B